MCGITGWANLDARTPPADDARELLTRCVSGWCIAVRTRRSDGFRRRCAGNATAAIIDLTPANNRLNEDENVAVILNGEIYNYRELRQELEKRGPQFQKPIGHGDIAASL